jgi:hypothetical protein
MYTIFILDGSEVVTSLQFDAFAPLVRYGRAVKKRYGFNWKIKRTV